jgi:hypothetical protein
LTPFAFPRSRGRARIDPAMKMEERLKFRPGFISTTLGTLLAALSLN